MREELEYFLRFFCPRKLYAYSTKIRIPQNSLDFRKFLVAKFVLNRPGSVIDGGAHIGYYTRYYSEILNENGTVYSFEPNPYIFRLLNKYAKSRHNIKAFQKALSTSCSRASFYTKPFSLAENSSLKKFDQGMKKVLVDTVSIDDLLHSIKTIRLIKLDVEGHEKQAILGAQKLIHRDFPWIILEYVQNELRNDFDILSLLNTWNYRCLDLQTLEEVPLSAKIDLTDVLAVPQNELEGDKLIDLLKIF